MQNMGFSPPRKIKMSVNEIYFEVSQSACGPAGKGLRHENALIWDALLLPRLGCMLRSGCPDESKKHWAA